MATCDLCGYPASPEYSSRWGNQCDDCISAQIELMLAMPRQTKPVKRAPPVDWPPEMERRRKENIGAA